MMYLRTRTTLITLLFLINITNNSYSSCLSYAFLITTTSIPARRARHGVLLVAIRSVIFSHALSSTLNPNDITFSRSSKQYQSIYEKVQELHSADAIRCQNLARSEESQLQTKTIANKNNKNNDNELMYDVILPHKISRSSATCSPILNPEECDTLQQSAELYWSKCKSSSRFTYQRPGNQELHVEELDDDALSIVNQALTSRIYPWLKKMFNLDDHDHTVVLSVYDALVIRYNATEALAAWSQSHRTHIPNDEEEIKSSNNNSNQKNREHIGAGQPLHRDLGMFSVNIALSDRDIGDFEGGGTFFEETLSVLHPNGRGHGLAHLSSARHAGSGTYNGVRDIIVIFITALPLYSIEYAMRCKNLFDDTEFQSQHPYLQKEDYYRAALQKNPHDSEAWQFLAMSLLESATQNEELSKSMLDLVLLYLKNALQISPNDARIHNNIGLALQKRLSFLTSNGSKIKDDAKIEYHFQKALEILDICSRAGCEVQFDECSTRLNFGLWLSYRDRYKESVAVLSASCLKGRIAGKEDTDYRAVALTRIQRDANALVAFCKQIIY